MVLKFGRMAEPVDRKKIRKIFQEVTDKEITTAQFEEILSTLTQDELLVLREFLVTARATGIRVLAERGWPMNRQKPN